ncbi:MAG TPA: AzlD domain-containing protein [Actinomycetota bacterium]|nr:AzlD domain-containing protein [Actinomycetota bacterium]
MSVWLIVGIAALTYGSRALALVFMREPREGPRKLLDRMPAPLFAGLAATSLFQDGTLVDERTLVATAGALVLTPTRSLLAVLLGGFAGYVLALLVL